MVVFVCVNVVQAHEFWLEPTKFVFKVGETMEMKFLVGENFNGKDWEIEPGKVARLDHFIGGAEEDLASKISIPDKKLSVRLAREGTHLFSLRSNNSFIELEAEEFNDYLKSDGQDDILQQREQNNELDKAAKEYYARCAKLLVQAGDSRDETYKKVAGLPLEIIPLNNPYSLEVTDQVSFQLLFQGRPLPFALVRVWNRTPGRTFIQKNYTEKDGTFTTRLSSKGVWMISTVKMIESRQPGADYQSFWASLVFGFNQ